MEVLYDFSTTTFSPEGKIFQVEYACKAVENGGTSLALKCKQGVVFAVEKFLSSKLLVPGSDRRIFALDTHVGITASGLVSDIRHLFNHGKSEAESYKKTYRMPVPIDIQAERIAYYVQLYTLYPVRPFGAAVIVGGVDELGPHLYMIEPSGVSYGYRGAAAGKAKQAAKTEIEKLNLEELSMRQAVIEAAKIIYKVHDDNKDKLFELEMAWICEESNNVFQFIPHDLHAEAIFEAQRAVREAEEMDDDE